LTESAAEFWDRRYRDEKQLWAAGPNDLLLELVDGLAPGRALDIGAGEGRNALGLSKRGWRVTALDISRVALGRAAQRAAVEGLELDCVVGDWREYLPGPRIDLAVISFMHPGPDERAVMFARAAEALVPGGHLFTVGVDLSEHGRRGPSDADRLYTPERLREALAGLELARCESVAYQGQSTHGPRPVVDGVAVGRRPAAGRAGR